MTKKKTKKIILPTKQQYVTVLETIKKQIEQSQAQAFHSINILLNQRNWIIGKIIFEQQSEHAWGSNFLSQLAQDLQNMFPGNSGLSVANIYRMKAFYQMYHNFRTAMRKLEDLPIFSIPWSHNITLLQQVKNSEEALWYAQKILQEGWSRPTLEKKIKSRLYHREGKAISNFEKLIPSADSALVQQSFKDPYCFDFLSLHDEHIEADLEQGLINNVQELLLEMGKGFALLGRQYNLHIGGKDFYIDLLFYHVQLKCYVVVELKAKEFEPKDIGQLSFYLSGIDNLLRYKNDNPTIGLLLCKTKNSIIAEYAVQDLNKPVGIASYETQLIKKLPKELKGTLPTIQEIEDEFAKKDSLQKLKKRNMKKTTKKIKKL